jgi:hypothetical protein
MEAIIHPGIMTTITSQGAPLPAPLLALLSHQRLPLRSLIVLRAQPCPLHLSDRLRSKLTRILRIPHSNV